MCIRGISYIGEVYIDFRSTSEIVVMNVFRIHS